MLGGSRWEKSGIATKVDAGLSRTAIHSSANANNSKRRSTREPYLYLASGASTLPPTQKVSLRKIEAAAAIPLPSSSVEVKNKTKAQNNNNNINHSKSDNNKKSSTKSLKRRESSSRSNTNLSKKNQSRKSASSSSVAATLSQSQSNLSKKQQRNVNERNIAMTAEEPLIDEKISKDIAAAVAMIVAEYEMLKRDQSNSSEVEEDDGGVDDATASATTTNSNLVTSVIVADNEASNKEVKAGELKEGNAVVVSNDSGSSSNPKNNPAATPNASIEPQPGGEQAQSSQLPEGHVTENNESSATLGLDLPPPLPPVKKFSKSRSSAIAPLPTFEARMGGQNESKKHLLRVQNYINTLGYQREGEPDIQINARHSMKSHMISAKDLIQAGRPIKCLHAVILTVYLTNALETVERFPIYFRSHVKDKEYKHIVLGIYCQGHFGALGISRDVGLQDKKLIYTKLSDLVFEFAKCYTDSGHILNEIKIGSIITHDQSSFEKVFSKIGTVPIDGCPKNDIESNVEKISKQLRAKMGLACLKASCFDKHCQHPFLGRSRSRMATRNTTTNTSTTISMAGSTTAFRSRSLSVGPIVPSSALNSRIIEDNKVPLLRPQISNNKAVTPARSQASTNNNSNNANANTASKNVKSVQQRSKTKVNNNNNKPVSTKPNNKKK